MLDMNNDNKYEYKLIKTKREKKRNIGKQENKKGALNTGC